MKNLFTLTTLTAFITISYAQNDVIIIDKIVVDGHECVNLGLPSGTLWATCNVGANSPSDIGDYFAWGENEDKCRKGGYSSENYLYEGTNIGIDISKSNYDVAHVKWGGCWRMPTSSEIRELCDKCTWKRWSRTLGGYVITGPNGNSIVLRAGGYIESGTILCYDCECYYWGSEASKTDLESAFFYGSEGGGQFDGHYRMERCNGLLVRPVTNVKDIIW